MIMKCTLNDFCSSTFDCSFSELILTSTTHNGRSRLELWGEGGGCFACPACLPSEVSSFLLKLRRAQAFPYIYQWPYIELRRGTYIERTKVVKSAARYFYKGEVFKEELQQLFIRMVHIERKKLIDCSSLKLLTEINDHRLSLDGCFALLEQDSSGTQCLCHWDLWTVEFVQQSRIRGQVQDKIHCKELQCITLLGKDICANLWGEMSPMLLCNHFSPESRGSQSL